MKYAVIGIVVLIFGSQLLSIAISFALSTRAGNIMIPLVLITITVFLIRINKREVDEAQEDESPKDFILRIIAMIALGFLSTVIFLVFAYDISLAITVTGLTIVGVNFLADPKWTVNKIVALAENTQVDKSSISTFEVFLVPSTQRERVLQLIEKRAGLPVSLTLFEFEFDALVLRLEEITINQFKRILEQFDIQVLSIASLSLAKLVLSVPVLDEQHAGRGLGSHVLVDLDDIRSEITEGKIDRGTVFPSKGCPFVAIWRDLVIGLVTQHLSNSAAQALLLHRRTKGIKLEVKSVVSTA